MDGDETGRKKFNPVSKPLDALLKVPRRRPVARQGTVTQSAGLPSPAPAVHLNKGYFHIPYLYLLNYLGNNIFLYFFS
jgi:hypothetical protein